MSASSSSSDIHADALPADMIVHAVPRSRLAPHLSPFVLKLECWLRLHRIPYKFSSKQSMHPESHKMPWIEYDQGRVKLWDTETIFAHLTRDLADTPAMASPIDAGMSPAEHATMRAFQRMLDEHLLWGLAIWRFIRDPEWSIWNGPALPLNPALKFFLRYFMYRAVKQASYGQGLGRLDDTVLVARISEDLQAVSDYLADKPFLMGDQPRSVDCSLFGHLTQFLYVNTTSPYTPLIKEKWPNLVQHHERMRQRCFPDWSQLINQARKDNGLPLDIAAEGFENSDKEQ